ATLLPPRPPENVRVLVTSRPHPGVPLDVPDDHPLRHCVCRRLDANEFARHTRDEAKRELHEALRGDRSQVDLLGLLTAAQGGLTARDLVELTKMLPYQLESRLASVLGRSLRTRTRWDLQEEQGYLFAHETLREQAEQALGPAVAEYRARIHAWADGYRDRGWPEETPGYLLHTYGRLLAGGDDLKRHLATITDPRRQERLLAVTGSDVVARADIQAARRRLVALPGADLGTVSDLALLDDELGHRGGSLPECLPAVWAALGRGALAEGMARSLLSPEGRSRALARMVAHTAVPDPRLARSVAEETADLARRSVGAVPSAAGYAHHRFCLDRATGLLRAGEPRAALAEALRPEEVRERVAVLRALAERARADTSVDVMELAEAAQESAELLRRRPDREQPDRALLLGCAALLVREAHPDRGERLLRAAEQVPRRRAGLALSSLALLLWPTDPVRAERLDIHARVRGGGAYVRQDAVPGDTFALCAAAERGEQVDLPPLDAGARRYAGEALALAGRTTEAGRAAATLAPETAAEVEAAIALSLVATAPEEAVARARSLAERSRSPGSDRVALRPVLSTLPTALATAGNGDLARTLSRHAAEPSTTWAYTLAWRFEVGAGTKGVLRRAGLRLPNGAGGLWPDAVDMLARFKGVDRAAALVEEGYGERAVTCLASLIRQLPPDDPRRARYAELARAKAGEEDPRPDPSAVWWAALAATLWGQPDAVRQWIASRERSVGRAATGLHSRMPRTASTRWLASPFERASAVLALARVDRAEARARFKEWRRRDVWSGSPQRAESEALWAMTAFLLDDAVGAWEPRVPEQTAGTFLATAALAHLGGGREWCSMDGLPIGIPSMLRRLVLLHAYAEPPPEVRAASGEQLVRDLLVRDDWWRVLPVLALLDPAAVDRFGETVRGRLS
ncbi:hypothetical protein, partial [Streptomyces silaceus]|uniref:hypothetical protein n=1 Tax=Streptomyces silaceus TaxID=545123 RepID=UPI0006EBDF3E